MGPDLCAVGGRDGLMVGQRHQPDGEPPGRLACPRQQLERPEHVELVTTFVQDHLDVHAADPDVDLGPPQVAGTPTSLDFRQCISVAALALPEVVAFDLSIAAQVFGYREEEMYEFALSRPAGTGPHDDGVCVAVRARPGAARRCRHGRSCPGIEDPRAALTGPWSRRSARPTGGARGWSRSAPARSRWRPPACSTDAGRPPIGVPRRYWRGGSRRCASSPDVLYVDEGRVLTSAGVAAGIDLCVHIVRRDFGQRRPTRSPAGSSSPRSARAARPSSSSNLCPVIRVGVSNARGCGRSNGSADPLTVAELARHAGYSERTFARRFRAETGTTPLQWLIVQRTLKARGLLEAGDLPVEAIARRCGFGSAPSLRQHFRRAVRSTPTAYRAAWSAGAANGD